jgi:hypothetical protein
MYLAQDGGQWRALVNKAMNPSDPHKASTSLLPE